MLSNLNFDWPSMRVALEGQSVIDLPKLNISNKAQARNFMIAYGYDTDDSGVREEVWRIYFQSLSFIREQLLDAGEKMPTAFLTRGPQTDILKLLVEASHRSSGRESARASPDGRWACAILRVMHIISQLDNDVRLENFHFAREQIFNRFDALVSSAGKRRWKFGNGPKAVTLVRYIKKERKERNSILIKLLSKPQAMVEDIYDRLGLRYVTETRLDAYRLVQAFFDNGVLCPPNVQPGRSVNNLISLEHLQRVLTELQEAQTGATISPREVKRELERLEKDSAIPVTMVRNPFTSRWYRAIQFTSRQLIVAPDPTHRFWTELQLKLKKSKSLTEQLSKIPILIREKRTFYYPFEVQILDMESYVESIGGRSRHREYKAKQRLMARNRVLRDLV